MRARARARENEGEKSAGGRFLSMLFIGGCCCCCYTSAKGDFRVSIYSASIYLFSLRREQPREKEGDNPVEGVACRASERKREREREDTCRAS